MNAASKSVQRTYLQLTLFSTLAASFIWGVNTLFLLDAGLSNTEAFTANAAFLLGQVIFEVPTGVVADTWGRRLSFLLGSVTLLITTLLYLLLWQVDAPLILWMIVSLFIGLGFTFFSGATEAWLVDALAGTGYKGSLEKVFARGQIFGGIAMLIGSVIGGVVAQQFGLGWPYLVRVGFFGLATVVAFVAMRDIGFTPGKPEKVFKKMRGILRVSLSYGFGKRPIRWVILSNVFLTGVSFYAFYAAQPHLLALYGDSTAYSIAGIAAALVAGSQVIGGLLAGRVVALFAKRTSVMFFATLVGSAALLVVWMTGSFAVAIAGFMAWAISFSFVLPVYQAYINGQIPSAQRATILSFSSMIGSVGGTVTQPALGKVADVYNYGTSFLVSGIVQLASLPFFLKARAENSPSDKIEADKTAPEETTPLIN